MSIKRGLSRLLRRPRTEAFPRLLWDMIPLGTYAIQIHLLQNEKASFLQTVKPWDLFDWEGFEAGGDYEFRFFNSDATWIGTVQMEIPADG